MSSMVVPPRSAGSGPAGRVAPRLPLARGPLSSAVIAALSGSPANADDIPRDGDIAGIDPYGPDLQLTLQICYELHYHGFASVDPDWEWQLDLLGLRAQLEQHFLAAVHAEVPGGSDLSGSVEELQLDSDGGVSGHLCTNGTWLQMREYFAHRSIYHLKEAEPHAWAIPRLDGQAKASLVGVEFDEFGGGWGSRMHSQLFRDLLVAADLDASYFGYLDTVPACTLATVNLMSLFGLRRRLRGALIGNFAHIEITSPPGSQRMVRALRRLGAPDPCILFYAEHVEADAVHEQVVRRDVIDDMIAREPALAEDIVFGLQATELLDRRFGEHLLQCWRQGRPSLSAAPS